MKIFTHTTGRTGTMWLAELFRLNTDWEVHHERLNAWDYGLQTPDIRQMRLYNEFGNVREVRNWWKDKFSCLPENYVETAHMLAKAGLNDHRDLLGEHRIIHLYRPIHEVVASMIRRADYVSHGNHWLWYLDPDYPRNLIDSAPFKPYGPAGLCAWYWREMEARKPVEAITVQAKDLNDPTKAKAFLRQCGVDVVTAIIPERKNASHEGEIPAQLQDLIEEVCSIAH